MSEQAPRLQRKAFGYDPSAVDQLLSERDAMLGLAERRVQAAEVRAHDLLEQVRQRDQEIADLREQVQVAAEVPAPKPAEPESEPLTPQFMSDELDKMIAAAEDSTAQILSRARQSTRDRILEADRLWREVQSEAVRFAEWRDQAEAAVGPLQAMIEQARLRIESVPERIQDALGPAVEAMIQMDEGISRFSQASRLPELADPAGLQTVTAEVRTPPPPPVFDGPYETPPPETTEQPPQAAPAVEEPDLPEPVAFVSPPDDLWGDVIAWGSTVPEPPVPTADDDPILALSQLGSYGSDADRETDAGADG